MDTLLGIGLAYGGYKALMQYKASEKLTFEFRDTIRWGVRGHFMGFTIRLRVHNPTNETLRVTRIGGNLIYQGADMGYFTANFPNGAIRPGSTEMEVPVTLNLVRALDNVPNLVTGILSNTRRDLSLKGQLYIWGLIPYRFDWKYSLKASDYIPNYIPKGIFT